MPGGHASGPSVLCLPVPVDCRLLMQHSGRLNLTMQLNTGSGTAMYVRVVWAPAMIALQLVPLAVQSTLASPSAPVSAPVWQLYTGLQSSPALVPAHASSAEQKTGMAIYMWVSDNC